ncbi:hypothetical protein [Luteimonas salinilitoris]|uniref:Uncharacterized protein n=1 Tax=Luteimonas salinilitoris TaxID=3237697 RepID=A0ABV4HW76_9GAMM
MHARPWGGRAAVLLAARALLAPSWWWTASRPAAGFVQNFVDLDHGTDDSARAVAYDPKNGVMLSHP